MTSGHEIIQSYIEIQTQITEEHHSDPIHYEEHQAHVDPGELNAAAEALIQVQEETFNETPSPKASFLVGLLVGLKVAERRTSGKDLGIDLEL